jgi:hypothetical protein
VLLLVAGPIVARAADEPPPLSPPTFTPPSTTPEPTDLPPTSRPAIAAELPAPIELRPMLVIPGVNAPKRVRTRGAPLPTFEPAGPPPGGDGPTLVGPGGPAEFPPDGAARPINPAPAAMGDTLSLETISEPIPDAPKPGAAPASGASTRPASPAARRPSGLLGRFLPAPFSAAGGNQSAITVEPSTDPAAEAALKRRIERQTQETLGDRVRDVEVRIRGRDVSIRARATRFWQRRTVRRTLEGLPSLSGYRPTVEILD